MGPAVIKNRTAPEYRPEPMVLPIRETWPLPDELIALSLTDVATVVENENALVILEQLWSDADTTTLNFGKAPLEIRHFTSESDNQSVEAQAVAPMRAVLLEFSSP
jgi:hypothetical protein